MYNYITGLLESPRERRRRLHRERRSSHHENVDLRRSESWAVSWNLHEESSGVQLNHLVCCILCILQIVYASKLNMFTL